MSTSYKIHAMKKKIHFYGEKNLIQKKPSCNRIRMTNLIIFTINSEIKCKTPEQNPHRYQKMLDTLIDVYDSDNIIQTIKTNFLQFPSITKF